jgi:hypothetical protein
VVVIEDRDEEDVEEDVVSSGGGILFGERND